jgi:hypothetical protein
MMGSDCIPKLAADGSNWPIYRDRMVFTLKAFTLDKHLINAKVSSPGSKAQPSDEAEAAIIWKREDAVVKQCIAASIPDEAFKRIKEDMSAKDVWDNLDTQFEDKSRIIREKLEKSLKDQQCEEKEDVRTYFALMTSLREQLVAAGGSITDDKYARILLSSLPGEYDTVVQSIKIAACVCKKKILPDVVTVLITREYEENIEE